MTILPSRSLADSTAALRAFVRSNALSQVAVAILVGAVAGVCVILMTKIAEQAHIWIYRLAFDERLSARASVRPAAALTSLCLGGFALGLMDRWRRARKSKATVDPIEANALHGGKLSFRDSLVVASQTLISNGCGASVGLEAGYAQIGSAIASQTGILLRLRRQDLRTLVGCGAAGAIAAAFAAPLTGAFYAFELIVGAYSLGNAGPIIAASLAATLTVKGLGGAPYLVTAPPVAALTIPDHLALVALGLVSAAVGVGAMRAAALVERSFQASPLPSWARPVVGGAILAVFATWTPQVLGAGHGALGLDIPRALSASTLVTLIALKLTACLVSLASGFRGGLFFASIFVGALIGKLFALGAGAAFPALALDPTACIFAGMATLGVAIVGGPLTMTFLVLESSGDLAVAGGVLAACIATSLAVRATFGYSFSTWRLHLRGETIRGAQDVGSDPRPHGRPDDGSQPADHRLFGDAVGISRRSSARGGEFRRSQGRTRALRWPRLRARGARPRGRSRLDLGSSPIAHDRAASGRQRQGGDGSVRIGAIGNPRGSRRRDRRDPRHARRGLCGAAIRGGDRSRCEGRVGRRVRR